MAFNELRAVATFIKAVELGSLRQAAASQGITPQAASLSLSQLEANLGVRLIHRTTRSLSLTEEGRAFMEAAQPGLATLQRALHGTRRGRDEIAGPLRIAAPRSIMLPMLWPVLEEFCQRYPEVEPDVQLDDRIGNWVEDRIDVGFRAGSPPAEGVVARRLLPIQLIVCAAPRYVQRHGMPTSIDELLSPQHRCSGFRHPATGKLMSWDFRVGEDTVSRAVPARLCTNDVELEVKAVLAGEFIGQLVGVSAAPLIRAGLLVPLLIDHVAEHLGLYAYYGSRLAQPARVRAFIDLAVERVAGNSEFFLTAQELRQHGAGAGQRRRSKKLG